MAAISFTNSTTSPYTTNLVGTEGFVSTRTSGSLVLNGTNVGLSGPCSQNANTSNLEWWPQTAGQQMFSASPATTYQLNTNTYALFKNATTGGAGVSNYTVNSSFSGVGTISLQGDAAGGGDCTITFTSSVAGLTGSSLTTSWFGPGIMIYSRGKVVLTDLPSQLNFGTTTASANLGAQVQLPVGASVTTFPTVLMLDSTYSNVAYTVLFESSGTGPAVSFGNASANRSIIKYYGAPSNTSTPTLQLGGDNTGNNTVLYDTAVGIGTLPFQKVGAGKWVLNGNNSAFTSTTIIGGTLTLNNDNATGGAAITMNANTVLEVTGSRTIAKNMTLNGIGTIRSVSGANTIGSAASTVSLAGATTVSCTAGSVSFPATGAWTGNVALTLGEAADTGDIAITGKFATGLTALTVTGTSGTVTLPATNDFTGAVTLNGRTLIATTLAASGVASNLGAGTTVNFGGTGKIRYTSNTSVAFTRALTFTSTTGAGFENTGTGSLAITPTSFTATGSGNIVALGGTSTGYNVFSGAFTGSAGGGYTKTGAGRWIVTGANNMTGTTTVSGGTLAALNATGAYKLLGGNVTVNSTATIQVASDAALGATGACTYNSLVFAGAAGAGNQAKIRIGGDVQNPTVYMNGTLTLPTGSGKVTFDLSAGVFKRTGIYTLIEFAPSVVTPISGGSVPTNTDWTGLPAGLTASLVYNPGPKTITVTISKVP